MKINKINCDYLLFTMSGLFSVIMRDLANMSGDGPKWIVLDGDIDPMWIESLNTVMDDNKVDQYYLNYLLQVSFFFGGGGVGV